MRVAPIIVSLSIVLSLQRAYAEADLHDLVTARCQTGSKALEDSLADAKIVAGAAQRDLTLAQEALAQARTAAAQAEQAERVAKAQGAADASHRKVDKAARDASAFHDLCDVPRVDWEKVKGRQFPRQYYAAQFQVDVCGDLLRIKLDDDAGVTIERLCGSPSTHETAGLNVASAGIDLVGGLGGLLEAEAKREVLEYLLSRLGKAFCEFSIPIDVPKAGAADKPEAGLAIVMKVWFANSCNAMLPNGSLEVDAFSFGGLKAAFKADVRLLPQNIARTGQRWLQAHWPNGLYYAVAIGVVAEILFDISQNKKPLEILDDLAGKADAALKGKVTCDLTAKAKITKECVAILGFEIAREAATHAKDRNPPIAAILGDALDRFCTDYGAKGLTQDGTCVVSKDGYEAWHQRLLAIYRAMRQLVDLDKAMASAGDNAFHAEISKRAAPELARALRSCLDAIAAAMEAALPDEKQRISDDMVVLDLGFDVFDAFVGDDLAGLRKALLAILDSKMIKDKSRVKKILRPLTVVVSLATAKDRAEVKDILQDVVSASGSYKLKYGAPAPIIALNGFVGFFVGREIRLHSRNADGTRHDPFREFAPLGPAVPVGVDVSLLSGGEGLKFWKPGDAFHVGITVTAIDPLALTVSTKDTLSAEWKTLFEPGLYVRVGLWRTPFTILAGANYRWGRHSDAMCGSERCYDGAFQIGAFVSADVPLLILR